MAKDLPRLEQRGEKYEVDPIELLFDLFYAFAVSQMTRCLAPNLSWRGVLETATLLVALYMVWSYTSWAATIVRADQAATRWMIISVIAAGFFMSVFAPGAFLGSGWGFVGIYLAIQFGRIFWTLGQVADAFSREHFMRVLYWQIASAGFWIAGAFCSSDARLLPWIAAAGIDLVGTWLAHPILGRKLVSENVEFNASHLLERCRLFRLIAIGEMVFTSGEAITSANLSPATVFLGALTLVEITAFWALTYGRFVNAVAAHIAATANPMRAGHYAINALAVILFGLVCISAANEQVILHPTDRPSPVLSFLIFGGPILFLAAQGWYMKMIPKIAPRHYVSISLLLLLVGLGSHFFEAWVGLVLAVLLIGILALLDSRIAWSVS